LAIITARNYGDNLINTPSLSISAVTYSIVIAGVTGLNSIFHFIAWAAFFRYDRFSALPNDVVNVLIARTETRMCTRLTRLLRASPSRRTSLR
jgi:hypothetical protein